MARKKAAAAAAKPVVVEGEDALDAREDLVVRALEVALHALPKDLSKLNRGAIKALMVKTVGTGKDALSEEVRARAAAAEAPRAGAGAGSRSFPLAGSVGRSCTHHSATHARPGARGYAPMSGGYAARRVSRVVISQRAPWWHGEGESARRARFTLRCCMADSAVSHLGLRRPCHVRRGPPPPPH
jgi:hypothetical protein